LLPEELPPPPVALLPLPEPVLPGLVLEPLELEPLEPVPLEPLDPVPLVPPGELGLLVALPPVLDGGGLFSALLPVPPLPVPPPLFCGHPIAMARAAAPTRAIQL
jgi:hypothetical protein